MQIIENGAIFLLTIAFVWIVIANRRAKKTKKESIKGLELVLTFILVIVFIIAHNS